MTDERTKKRILLIGIIFLLLFLLLLIKLFCKQTDMQRYNQKILHQSVRKIRIPARRGRIYTADNYIAADNRMSFDLLLYVHEIRRQGREATIDAVLDNIIEIALRLGRENRFTREDVRRHLNWYPGLPIKVFSDLDERERAVINDYQADRPGWALEIDAVRTYPLKSCAAHLIGYTRKGDPGEAADRKDFSYYISDYEGIAGLEKAFDRINMPSNPTLRGLRGKPGYSLVQVDNLGYVRHSLVQEIAPLHGNHLALTIEYKAQKIAEDILKNNDGALVLLDADNGDVIAMASAPAYDLNRFSPRIERAYYQALLKDPDRPLMSKAISGTYTPGSIVKVLIALGILENGTPADSVIKCDGYTPFGDAKLHCTSYWYGGHGEMDVFTALEKSCNDYFVENGLKLGRKKIHDLMFSAGFGTAPQFELNCAPGILPTIENKQRVYRSRWTEFDTALISIGQGMVTISPLQAALYAAAIANNGKVYRPHIVKAVLDQQGNALFERIITVDHVIPGSEKSFNAVQQGMFKVVNSSSGSGRKAKLQDYVLYGKTGTAEIGSRSNRTHNTWFIAFVRHKGRTYAAAMIIKDGKSGGSTCAPKMAEFFERYLAEK